MKVPANKPSRRALRLPSQRSSRERGVATLSSLFESEILNMTITACSERPFGQDVRELLQSAARQMTKQSLDGNIRGIIEGVGAHCESALELSLCLLIGIAARSQEYAVLFDFRGPQIFGDPEGDVTVRVRPQVRFGDYRVDLLVAMQSIEGQEDSIRVRSKTAVVECDGFEFHDATKEQACHDLQRDRYLQSLGMPVLRFAGTDIWNDVFACAGSFLSFLLSTLASEQEIIPQPAPRKPPAIERRVSALRDRRRA
jgi:very-short-patch-repair endonuclease